MESRWLRRTGLVWIVGAVLISAAALTVYTVGQQAARRTVDDTPRALARQAQALLAAGAAPATVASGPAADLAQTAAPFLIVYDADHGVAASTASLAGAGPRLPSGVLDDASAQGENHVTWQPAAGVREAVVATGWQSASARGVVVAGVSLTSTEQRTATLLTWVAVAWVVAQLAWIALVVGLTRQVARHA